MRPSTTFSDKRGGLRYNSGQWFQVGGAETAAGMKARVYVTLKKSVLDPQGQAILQAVSGLGFRDIKNVRQGKVFEMELNGVSPEQARQEVERVAREVLTNPVIEEFRCEIEE